MPHYNYKHRHRDIRYDLRVESPRRILEKLRASLYGDTTLLSIVMILQYAFGEIDYIEERLEARVAKLEAEIAEGKTQESVRREEDSDDR